MKKFDLTSEQMKELKALQKNKEMLDRLKKQRLNELKEIQKTLEACGELYNVIVSKCITIPEVTSILKSIACSSKMIGTSHKNLILMNEDEFYKVDSYGNIINLQWSDLLELTERIVDFLHKC